MRVEIEKRCGLDALDIYGLSEIIGPGVAGECLDSKGALTIWEDYFYPEIVDPETGKVLPDGEFGELVITSLCKEAFPIIRYRTRDLTRLIPEPCPCGRTFDRLHRIMGRTDDMLIIKGVNVFPTQIEAVLFEIEGTEPHYRIIVDRENHEDSVTVMVEVVESIFFDSMKEQRGLVEKIKRQLASELGIGVKVKLVEEKTLERFDGKGARVIDNRKL